MSIAISGVKGGVGRSVIAANLAVASAMRGDPTLLFDAGFADGGVARILGLEPKAGIDEVLDGALALDELVLDGPTGLKVIASRFGDIGLSRLSHFDHASLIALFSDLRVSADRFIVDTPSGLSDANLAYTSSTREILLVTTDDPAAIEATAAALRELNASYCIRRFRVITNRVQSTHHGQDVFARLERALDTDLDVLMDHVASIPDDPRLAESAADGMAVVERHPRSAAALALSKLGERIARWPRPVSPCGHIEFFVERLVQTAGPHLVRAKA